MDTLKLLRDELHARYDVPAESVTPDATLESLGIDSLGLVELLFELEDKQGIRTPSDFRTPHTVADVIEIIDQALAAHAELPATSGTAA